MMMTMERRRSGPAVVGLLIVLFVLAASCGAQTPPRNSADTPADDQEQAPDERIQQLLPEGYRITDRRARLVRHPEYNRWFLCFLPVEAADQAPLPAHDGESLLFAEPDPADPFSVPMEVLPGKWLANMINFCGNEQDASVVFRVWGEVTVYQQRNYVLPTFVAALSIFGDQPQQPARNNDGSAPGLTEPDLPDRLRETLLSIPRTRPLAGVEETRRSSAAAGRADAAQEAIWLDGTALVDRVGRLMYDSDERRWMFAFEADAQSLAEPPVAILPGRLLEVMEQAAGNAANRALKFRISGQVTRYQQQNFILLRKVLLVYDSGNLGG